MGVRVLLPVLFASVAMVTCAFRAMPEIDGLSDEAPRSPALPWLLAHSVPCQQHVEGASLARELSRSVSLLVASVCACVGLKDYVKAAVAEFADVAELKRVTRYHF